MSSLPRCWFCNGQLECYEGRPYCPSCEVYEPAAEDVDGFTGSPDDPFTTSPDDPILLADRIDYQQFTASPEGLLEWVQQELAYLQRVEAGLIRLVYRMAQPSQAKEAPTDDDSVLYLDGTEEA